MEDIRVAISYKCDICDGAGIIYDPYGFWEKVLEDTRDMNADQYGEHLMLKLGISPGDEPPEEGPCIECDGTGRLHKQIPLQQLTEMLSPIS